MKTYSIKQLPTYQLVGDIVRVHWDESVVVVAEEDQYCYEELVVPKSYTPDEAQAIGVPPNVAKGFLPENFVGDQNG